EPAMKPETYLSSQDIANKLNVSSVTIRKYAAMLEKNDYNFARDTKGWRQYNESDLAAMEYIYTHSKLSGKSLEEVTKLVATLYRSNLSISDTATPLQDVNVADLIQRQEEFNRAILKRLEQFEEQQKKRDEN
uniref:MerR family transcriptional regulator n=1 Tax=Staphylococcus saprophyticus TaxID=29385 RepID=UPI0021B3D2FF